MTDRCSSCQREIVWIVDQDGTQLPVDKKRGRGYVLSDELDERRRTKAVYETHTTVEGKVEALLRRRSHFETCPHAGKHSQPKARLLERDDPMPWGKKHAGTPMGSVPANYLLWAADNSNMSGSDIEDVRIYVATHREELEQRAEQCAQQEVERRGRR